MQRHLSLIAVKNNCTEEQIISCKSYSCCGLMKIRLGLVNPVTHGDKSAVLSAGRAHILCRRLCNHSPDLNNSVE